MARGLIIHHTTRLQTMRCSEPGGSVAVAIVASRAPGRYIGSLPPYRIKQRQISPPGSPSQQPRHSRHRRPANFQFPIFNPPPLCRPTQYAIRNTQYASRFTHQSTNPSIHKSINPSIHQSTTLPRPRRLCLSNIKPKTLQKPLCPNPFVSFTPTPRRTILRLL
jgi:hypothetical protein